MYYKAIRFLLAAPAFAGPIPTAPRSRGFRVIRDGRHFGPVGPVRRAGQCARRAAEELVPCQPIEQNQWEAGGGTERVAHSM